MEKPIRAKLAVYTVFFALLLSGCARPVSFERYAGPLSPPGLLLTLSGILRDRLFPHAQNSIDLCHKDYEACLRADGILLESTAAGKKAARNLKVMLAIELGTDDPEQTSACAALADRLFAEKDADAYEVSMRVLAAVTADSQSPLTCVISHLDDRQQRRGGPAPAWSDARLDIFVDSVLKGRWVAHPPTGILAEGAFDANAAQPELAFSTLKTTPWLRASSQYFFAGNALGWGHVFEVNPARDFQAPSKLIARFQSVFSGYFANPSDLSAEARRWRRLLKTL